MSDSWRPASKVDRPLLEAFTCTDPPPRVRNRPVPHPRPWEYEVQRWIRHEAEIGRAPDEDARVLILPGEEEILAVTSHRRHLRLTEQIGAPVRLLTGTAITRSRRGQGGALADEAHQACFEDIAAREGASGEMILIGMVHPDNHPSGRALVRAGMRRDPAFERLRPQSHYHAYIALLRTPLATEGV